MKALHILLVLLFLSAMGIGIQAAAPTENPTDKRVLWQFDTQGPVRSTPVTINDTLYFSSDSGYLYGVKPKSNDILWTFKADAAMPSVPVIESDNLYISTKKGTLYAIAIGNGQEIWKFSTPAPALYPGSWDYFIASPCLTAKFVIFGSGDHTLYALHKDKGTVAWKYQTQDMIRATPVVEKNIVYCGTMGGELLALSLDKGKVKWSFKATGSQYFPKGEFLFKPLVYQNTVYVGSRDASFYAVDASTGKLKWKTTDAQGAWYTTATAAEGIVYTASSDGHYIQALDAQTGQEKWKFFAQDLIFSTPVVEQENLYFGSHDGYVYALNRTTGQARWRYQTGDDVLGSPLIIGNTLFIGSDDGHLYALDTTPPIPGHKTVRAVYYMPQWDKKVSMITSPLPQELRHLFGNQGYETLNAPQLMEFLKKRVESNDATSSVIVLASFVYPHAILQAESNTPALLSRYLDSGGTLVWLGNIPQLLLTLKEKEEKPTVASAEMMATLGVDEDFLSHACSYYDAYICHPTAEGQRLGLPAWWSSGFGVKPEQVTTVLGMDEHHRATAWFKNYGGPAGTGFIRLWGNNQLPKDMDFIFKIIENKEL